MSQSPLQVSADIENSIYNFIAFLLLILSDSPTRSFTGNIFHYKLSLSIDPNWKGEVMPWFLVISPTKKTLFP